MINWAKKLREYIGDPIDVKACPYTYKETNKLRIILKRVTPEKLEQITIPCNNCFVNSSCKEHCIDVYRFLNYMADHLPTMTADELCVYRHIVPSNIKERIHHMLQSNTRLAHPKL